MTAPASPTPQRSRFKGSRFKPSRASLWRLALLAPIAGAAWLLSTPDPLAPEVPDVGPSFQADDVRHIVLRENGETLCELSARRIIVSRDKLALLADDVRGGTLYQNGKPALNISAARVRYEQNSGNIWASGQVDARGKEFAMSAESAFWNKLQGRLIVPKTAFASWRGVAMQGTGAFYDAKGKRFVCPQPSRANVPNLQIRAGRTVASLQSRTLQASGGVEILARPNRDLRAVVKRRASATLSRSR